MKDEIIDYHVFISYPHQELDIAKHIYDSLSGRFRVFMDKYSLITGDDWTKEIIKAQKKSGITIALISKNTKDSCYEKDEITRAINLRKRKKHIIFPIVVSHDGKVPEMPFGLQNTQYLVINKNYDMTQLYASIVKAMMPNIEKFGFSPEIDIYTPTEITFPTSRDRFYQRQIEEQFTEEEILNFFLKRIQKHSYKKQFFFGFLDIEKFTQLNTIYGKKCADEVLKVIEKIIRDYDESIYCRRLFSDEFCMVIPGCNLDEGFKVMETLQKTIFLYNWNVITNGLRVSTSIGISEMELNRQYSKIDVKEGIVKAAIGCANIGDIVDSFYEEEETKVKVTKKFPKRIKKGPSYATPTQLNTPLRETCS